MVKQKTNICHTKLFSRRGDNHPGPSHSPAATLDAVSADGNTPLLRAAFEGRAEACMLLVAAQADVDRQDTSGNTALV